MYGIMVYMVILLLVITGVILLLVKAELCQKIGLSICFIILLFFSSLLIFSNYINISKTTNIFPLSGFFLILILLVFMVRWFFLPSVLVTFTLNTCGNEGKVNFLRIYYNGVTRKYKNIKIPFQVRLFFTKGGEHTIYITYQLAKNGIINKLRKEVDLDESKEIEIELS